MSSRLARLLPAQDRRAWDGPWGPYPSDGSIPGPGEVPYGDGGAYVSERTALQLIDVYACVSLLADSMLQLPLDSFRRAGTGQGFREEVAPPPLLVQPDPEIERWDHVSRMVTSLATRGDSYNVVLARDTAGYPSAIRAIHPDDVRPYWGSGGTRLYKLRGVKEPLTKHDLLHVPLVTLPGALTGLSPIDCARRGIRLAIQTETFGDRWFSDGAAPSSVLESEQQMDDDQANRVLARFVVQNRNRRKPAVLTGGLKWKPITITPEESQFLESRKLNTAQIARIWRIAPHLIGDVDRSTSWGSGIEEQGIGFVVFTLGPYLARLEAMFSRCMPRPRYAKFNVGALLRGSTKDRYAAYAVARQWGWMSVNDIRRLEDLPPVDGGDTYLQPLNMVDAEQALAALKIKGAVDDGS